MNLAEQIQNNYKLNLTHSDQEMWESVAAEQQEVLRKKLLRKYEMAATILKVSNTPRVRQTLEQLLDRPIQISLKAFTRLFDMVQFKKDGYLDIPLFDKYHRQVINKSQVHRQMLDLVNQAKDEGFTADEFQDYLRSGLFDKGIYVLKRGPSEEELKAMLNEMEADVYTRYGYMLCPQDKNFVLRNKVRNTHIINQIVVPKYRIAREIEELLGSQYLDAVIHEQLDRGLNDGVPILKRIRALAEWRHDGFLSDLLVKKFHYTLVHDLDELEEFFKFLERISEFISKDRGIHYMELGMYEVFNESRFKKLLQVEQVLYDVSDDLGESVREYLRIMNTPASSKSLITNGRLAQCFEKFVRCLDTLFNNSELLSIEKHLEKLQTFQSGLVKLYAEFRQKNPTLPAQKPYKAMESIRPFARLQYSIQCENLLRMSMEVVQHSQKEIVEFKAPEKVRAVPLLEAAERFQDRVQNIRTASNSPKDMTDIVKQLVPFETTPLYEIQQYLGKSSRK